MKMRPSGICIKKVILFDLLAVIAGIILLGQSPVLGGCQGDCIDFGPMGYPTHFEDYDGDGYTVEQGDCDDIDPLEFPGQTWYKDLDNDGYSDGTLITACLRPVSYKVATELYRITGDINDQVADPKLNSLPVINSIQPIILTVNDKVTFTGSGFGNLQGSAYVNFSQNVKTAKILQWKENSVVIEVPQDAQNGCVEIVTVMGKSNCVGYTIARPMPWFLLLK